MTDRAHQRRSCDPADDETMMTQALGLSLLAIVGSAVLAYLL